MIDREPRFRQIQKDRVRFFAHPEAFPTDVAIPRHDERLRQAVHLELVPSFLGPHFIELKSTYATARHDTPRHRRRHGSTSGSRLYYYFPVPQR